MTYELFGWLGLILIQGSRIPQLIHMLASKQARGLSLSSNIAVQVGLASYLVYAVIVQDRVFIASNLAGLLGQSWVVYLNWKWREKPAIIEVPTFPKPMVPLFHGEELYRTKSGGWAIRMKV